MTNGALRPRTYSEIVDAAFQILKAHYPQFVMCSAIAYVPWVVVQLVFIGDLRDPEMLIGSSSVEVDLSVLWRLFGLMGGVWIVVSLMSGVIVTCASQAYLGEPVDVAVAVRRALPRLPRLLVASFMRNLLFVFGLFAMLIGSLYVLTRYFAVTPAIILEDAGISRAFTRSSGLSKGRKMHILNTLGLVGIIFWVVSFGVSAIASIGGNFVVQTIAGALYTIMAYPVIAITECLLYYDSRIQSEGLDIQLMANELMAPAGMP